MKANWLDETMSKCSLCAYEPHQSEKDTWAWCFECGNGSPAYGALKEAVLRGVEKVTPVLTKSKVINGR